MVDWWATYGGITASLLVSFVGRLVDGRLSLKDTAAVTRNPVDAGEDHGVMTAPSAEAAIHELMDLALSYGKVQTTSTKYMTERPVLSGLSHSV